MSSSKGFLRSALVSMAFVIPAGVLAGCGLTPLYGDTALTRQTMALSYPEPNSRLEQIVYQELGRSFAPSYAPDAPKVNVRVSAGARTITHTTNPGTKTSYEMVANGTINVVRDKKVVLNVARQASATYTISGQVLADNAAEQEAYERATRALAETLRLTLLATFATSPAAQ